MPSTSTSPSKSNTPSRSSATPSSPPNTVVQDRKRKPWSTEDLRGVLQGTSDTHLVREADRKGLSMATFGAMTAAVTSEALLPLLDLLEPPVDGETSKIDVVIALLEQIAASQARIEARLAATASTPTRSK